MIVTSCRKSVTRSASLDILVLRVFTATGNYEEEDKMVIGEQKEKAGGFLFRFYFGLLYVTTISYYNIAAAALVVTTYTHK